MRPCAKPSSVTRGSESHAVLDAERDPVPREVGRPRQADDRYHGSPRYHENASTCSGYRRQRALALGDNLVALDERGGHPRRLPYGMPRVKPAWLTGHTQRGWRATRAATTGQSSDRGPPAMALGV